MIITSKNTTQQLIPEKNVIMPTKKRYLFRVAMSQTAEIPESLHHVINTIYQEGLKLSQPIIYWRHFSLSSNGNKPAEIFPSHLIPEKLKESTQITLFASTLGNKLDQRIEQYLNASQTLKSTLLDAWASEAIETLNTWFDNKLRTKLGKGTNRFSPGYEDIPITANNTFIEELLNIKTITANKTTGILTPRKSTICLIGWFK